MTFESELEALIRSYLAKGTDVQDILDSLTEAMDRVEDEQDESGPDDESDTA